MEILTFWLRILSLSDWQSILGLVIAGATLLGGLVTAIIKAVKFFKEIVKNKDWKKITEMADAAMEQAELSCASGVDKKTMVIEIVKASCKKAGLDVGEVLDDLSKYIDDCIEFHNKLSEAKKLAEK